jgi:hypothetical protein
VAVILEFVNAFSYHTFIYSSGSGCSIVGRLCFTSSTETNTVRSPALFAERSPDESDFVETPRAQEGFVVRLESFVAKDAAKRKEEVKKALP